jgi:hypothetical protein
MSNRSLPGPASVVSPVTSGNAEPSFTVPSTANSIRSAPGAAFACVSTNRNDPAPVSSRVETTQVEAAARLARMATRTAIPNQPGKGVPRRIAMAREVRMPSEPQQGTWGFPGPHVEEPGRYGSITNLLKSRIDALSRSREGLQRRRAPVAR